MAIATYSAKSVQILAGVAPVEGVAPDTFISITPSNNLFNTYYGIDAEIARIKRYDRQFDVQVSLLQSSISNTVLSAQYNVDAKLPNGFGALPLTLLDTNGFSVFFSAFSWINNPPVVSYNDRSTIRVWTFTCTRTISIVNGFGD